MPVDRLRRQLLVQQREAAEAAVPDDLGGDALVDGARRPRIDEEGEVGVAVDVDEAGRDDLAGGVDLPVAPRRRPRPGAMRPSTIPTSAGTGSAARAVDDEAVADREVDAHRAPRACAVASTSTRAVGDHDAVALARGGDRHLAVEDVVEDGGGVALERRAEAAAAGGDVREAVALDERERLHRHRRQLAASPARDDDVARRRPGLAALEAVGRMVAAVGADRQRRPAREHAGTRARRRARRAAARPRRSPATSAVALDPQREVGLEQLDGLVAEVRERVRDALEAVACRPRPPRADEHLGRPERPPLLVVATPGDQRRPALAGREHAIGHERRERAHDRVVDAVADHAARAAGGGQHGVDDGAGRRVDPDRRHVALAVRDLAADDAADGAVAGGVAPSRPGS